MVNYIRESKDLSKTQTELPSSMEPELLSRLQTIGADFPEVKPSYDPNNPPTIRSGSGGQRDREARGNREGENRELGAIA